MNDIDLFYIMSVVFSKQRQMMACVGIEPTNNINNYTIQNTISIACLISNPVVFSPGLHEHFVFIISTAKRIPYIIYFPDSQTV